MDKPEWKCDNQTAPFCALKALRSSTRAESRCVSSWEETETSRLDESCSMEPKWLTVEQLSLTSLEEGRIG